MRLVQSIATAMSPKDYDLQAEHVEHVWQMNLLGDPMLRLSHPDAIELTLPSRAEPGERVELSGQVSSAGRLIVEFGYRRGQVSPLLPKVPAIRPLTGEIREKLTQRYSQANNPVILAYEVANQSAGKFAIPLEIPADLPRGKYCVRVFVEGENGWQVGYEEISVRVSRQASDTP